MTWHLFSFFLNNEEEFFIELNPNFLETNVINILILIGILLYANKISFSTSLQGRQKEISQTIENAQKDVIDASTYYKIANEGYNQTIFWLQSWRNLYQKEKTAIVTIKYNLVKKGFIETFSTSETLINNFESKAFISLQRYIILVAASKVLRKFLLLSEKDQTKFVETTITKLGGMKK